MKVQVISDTHLEFFSDPRVTARAVVEPKADYLFLCGDICECGESKLFEHFVYFINYITPKYQLVIHVAGNHEYYSSTGESIATIKSKFRELERSNAKYKFLDNECIEIKASPRHRKSYIIAGTTLWTDIPKKLEVDIKYSMNDYKRVFASAKKNITPAQVTRLNKDAREFIDEVRRKHKNKDIILLTHHKPIMVAPPPGTPRDDLILKFAYENELKGLLAPPIVFAAHGHVHQHNDVSVTFGKQGATRKLHIYANPRGYPYQKTNFNPGEVITLH